MLLLISADGDKFNIILLLKLMYIVKIPRVSLKYFLFVVVNELSVN